jgi:hypothetical protein
MQPSTAAETSAQRTFSSSYIIGPEPDIWLHPFFDPLPSMFIFAPPRRKPRRKRARVALSGADRANAYAALLNVDDYSEQARDALRAGDDAGVRHALEVLAAIVAVVIGQLQNPSENRVLQ